MRKYIFSALIFCGLLEAAPTQGQTFGEPGVPVVVSQGDHSGLFAYAENNIVILRWQAGNEKYIDHFVVEHSTDSLHFDPLHELVSRGDIDGDHSYQDQDSYPASRTNYYRLKVVDKEGGALYYPIVRVDLADESVMMLKPSVVHMGATVRLDAYHEQPLAVNVFNEKGSLTGSFLVNSTSFNINTAGWSRGLYFYRISDPRHPLLYAGKIMIL